LKKGDGIGIDYINKNNFIEGAIPSKTGKNADSRETALQADPKRDCLLRE